METEIELKFFVLPSFLEQIKEAIDDIKILQQSKRQLFNVYFDTQDFLLRSHDIGLRIRRFDNVYVQTLKTAGRVVAGLHQRPEYNAELNSKNINLSLIPENALPPEFDLEQLKVDLLPIFSTDFERHQWLIAMPDGSQIELAFDLGNVSTDNQKQDIICEVEIELKSGQIDALFLLARKLAEKGELRLGNLSKAARGYRLAMNYQGDLNKHLGEVPVLNRDTVEQGFVKSLEHALEHWHFHEQIYVERQDTNALVEFLRALTLIHESLSIYARVIPQRASALLCKELQWLEDEFAWVDESFAINCLCEDKGYFLRKLNAKKQLFRKLNQRVEKLPTAKQVLALLHSSRYCNLLLDLSRWLLTRGWQPFLDQRAREMLNQPLIDYANTVLSASWTHLLSDFSLENNFDSATYLDKQTYLRKNLLSGCCLGALYDSQRTESFRLPWLDLLQGIEDLSLLESVKALLVEQDISEENKAQMEKWLTLREESLLYAMLQSRAIGLTLEPYWVV